MKEKCRTDSKNSWRKKESICEKFSGHTVSVPAALLKTHSGTLLNTLSAPGPLKENTSCTWASQLREGERDFLF